LRPRYPGWEGGRSARRGVARIADGRAGGSEDATPGWGSQLLRSTGERPRLYPEGVPFPSPELRLRYSG